MTQPSARTGILVGVLLVPGAALAADPSLGALAGTASYRVHCAVCHGTDARGDGLLTDHLSVRPPDLTLLARRNAGRYPADMVRRVIDGRDPLKGHGGPDMPIWGDVFKEPGAAYSEDKVKEKIDGLVEYLRTLQAPPK